jgi:hypothetical protein
MWEIVWRDPTWAPRQSKYSTVFFYCQNAVALAHDSARPHMWKQQWTKWFSPMHG